MHSDSDTLFLHTSIPFTMQDKTKTLDGPRGQWVHYAPAALEKQEPPQARAIGNRLVKRICTIGALQTIRTEDLYEKLGPCISSWQTNSTKIRAKLGKLHCWLREPLTGNSRLHLTEKAALQATALPKQILNLCALVHTIPLALFLVRKKLGSETPVALMHHTAMIV